MSQRFKQFQAAFQEDTCLELVMRAREGGTSITCAACGRVSAFVLCPKLRACACSHCSYLVYPCAGTPLESRRTALSLWFFAIKLLAEQGAKQAIAALERDADVSPMAARRMIDALTVAAEKSGGRGPTWLDAVKARVADKPSVQMSGSRAARSRTPEKPASPRDTAKATQEAAAAPAPSPAQPGRMKLAAFGFGAVGLVIAIGFAAATLRPAVSPDEMAAIDAPALKAAPARPSLILSAVEDDLEAARQATQFALKNDPSLAAISPQEPGPEELVPPQLLPPPNILLVPPRLPQGPVLPPTQLPRAPVVSGDPDQILTFGPIRIRRHLVDMIVRAGRVVGADPTLLMAVADKESSFSTAVQAKTSSATGLYQFIEQTWLGVIYEFGSRHGLAAEVRQIGRSGRQFIVADPAERQRILDLRREPYLSALLAAEMLKRDTLRLEKAMGRHLTGGEIYLIHFLGPDAAQTFIETMEETPGTKAAELLPRPAQANRPIFYAEAGGETKTLSVSEVHKKFNDMIKLRLDRYGDVRRLWFQNAQRQSAPR